MSSATRSEGRLDSATRILDAAYELFSHEGVVTVGVDRIADAAGVAKMTLYRHFSSKEELVLAFLALRGRRWSREWLQAETERRAPTPAHRALTVFEVLDDWFRDPEYEGCTFLRTLYEVPDPEAPVRRAALDEIASIRATLDGWARDAGAAEPEAVGGELHLLMMGAIAAAVGGDQDAARRAARVAATRLPA
ncbi:MAG: regulatory protein TetR [Solirubrobacterales bacterium]|jgi:AcrR family transcriptional regulator|nr:regulatory protein TetR [Solirubrobacterales bacterium]